MIILYIQMVLWYCYSIFPKIRNFLDDFTFIGEEAIKLMQFELGFLEKLGGQQTLSTCCIVLTI